MPRSRGVLTGGEGERKKDKPLITTGTFVRNKTLNTAYLYHWHGVESIVHVAFGPCDQDGSRTQAPCCPCTVGTVYHQTQLSVGALLGAFALGSGFIITTYKLNDTHTTH